MVDDQNPYPAWAENATKGDLIRAVVYMRSNMTALASVVIALAANNEEEARSRMSTYFTTNAELDRVMNEIAGRP